MCSEYTLKTSPKEIKQALGVAVANQTSQTEWDTVVKFTRKAPVIKRTDEGLEIVERVFPVSPFPNARMSAFENQTDAGDPSEEDNEDAKQIRRIYEAPRWKKGFSSVPYLVPMTEFTEFAYWGADAGSAVGFKPKNEELFFAAGIGIKPFTPKTGKEDGFAILTHVATKQMLEYHFRLITFFSADKAAGYLEPMNAQERFNYVLKHRYSEKLNVEKLRPMAKGWEKRTPVQVRKLEREKSYEKTLKDEGVSG